MCDGCTERSWMIEFALPGAMNETKCCNRVMIRRHNLFIMFCCEYPGVHKAVLLHFVENSSSQWRSCRSAGAGSNSK